MALRSPIRKRPVRSLPLARFQTRFLLPSSILLNSRRFSSSLPSWARSFWRSGRRAEMVPTQYYLILSAILFGLGIVAFVFRRNIITIFMSIELMLNAVNLSFVAFSQAMPEKIQVAGSWMNNGHKLDGQIFVLFVIV